MTDHRWEPDAGRQNQDVRIEQDRALETQRQRERLANAATLIARELDASLSSQYCGARFDPHSWYARQSLATWNLAMSFFADMGTVTMGAAGPRVRAIGWLDPEHPFPSGEAPEGFVDCLQRFVQASRASGEGPSFGLFLGSHDCEFCNDCGAPGYLNIGVPFADVIFIAPELVVHYVTRHCYLPPQDFITAVMNSALPGTAKYRAAVAPFLNQLDPSPADERQIADSVRAWVQRTMKRR